jgi:hypothetical protein
LDAVLQGLAFQVLHYDERLTFVIADVVNDTDMRVVQCRCCSGFPLEPLQSLFVLGVFLRQELQSDIATQAGVLCLIDHTHPTAAELLCDFVVGDGLADHVS